jgi:transcriptional regulator
VPAKVCVGPGGDGAQKLGHGARGKFTPLDAKFVFVPARHVRVDDGRVVLRPQRQIDDDLDAGQHPRLEVSLDPRTADAEIGDTAFPDRESMSYHSHGEINRYPLAPTMFHLAIIPQAETLPHRTNTERVCDKSYTGLNYRLTWVELSRHRHAGVPPGTARPLATLVALSDSGLVANHIPLETLPEPPPHGVLRGHIARANPLWREYRADSEALAIFHGPQAYISPSFYPAKQETGEVVPTWDYAVVHARGTLRFVQDAAWLRALVSRLTDAHEAPRPMPWKIDDAPPPYIERMLSMIVGFELSIVSLMGKWKLSQNHPTPNRRGVVKGLRDAAGEESRQVADMLSSLEERPDGPHD